MVLSQAWQTAQGMLLAPFQRPHLSSEALRKDIRIQSLYIHPIKSCKGSLVPEIRYTRNGLYLDRTWLIVDAETKRFQTARELPQMVLIEPQMDFDEGVLRINVPLTAQGKGVVTIVTPLEPAKADLEACELITGITLWKSIVDGYAVSSDADRVLSEFFGRPVRLVRKGPLARQSGPDDRRAVPTLNYQDFYPLLVANEASIQHVRDTLMKSVYHADSTDADATAMKSIDLASSHARAAALRSADSASAARAGPWTNTLLASTLLCGASILIYGGAGTAFVAGLPVRHLGLALIVASSLGLLLASHKRSLQAFRTVEVPSIPVPATVNKNYWTPEQLKTLPITRFRPNIVLASESATGTPPLVAWEEDGFTEMEVFDKDGVQDRASSSSLLPFGSKARNRGKVTISCMARCARCLVTTIDPSSGVRDPHLPYKVLQGYRMAEPASRKVGKPCFGVLSAIQDSDRPGYQEGVLKVGDIVRVTRVMDPAKRVATPA
ncbi:unnamed protein product [Parajaminaea phylloscopi]